MKKLTIIFFALMLICFTLTNVTQAYTAKECADIRQAIQGYYKNIKTMNKIIESYDRKKANNDDRLRDHRITEKVYKKNRKIFDREIKDAKKNIKRYESKIKDLQKKLRKCK
jgi:predicted ATPase